MIAKGGKGNTKIGPGVFTFSMTAGPESVGGTCPGASDWCAAHCYAMRLTRYTSVRDRFSENADATRAGMMPEIPAKARSYRIHVSGDFHSAEYVEAWRTVVRSRPEVHFYAYTRSWRVPEIVSALESLRAEPNMQLFASVDASIAELPPSDWRVAYIDGDPRFTGIDCPEQTGRKANCEECGYCIRGKRGNVNFSTH